ncbi:MAG: transglycosylase domain-containing protein [bacterium]
MPRELSPDTWNGPSRSPSGEEGSNRSQRDHLTTRMIVFRWAVLIISTCLFLSVCAALGMGVVWLRAYLDAIPEIPYLEHYRPTIPSRFVDSKGNLIHEVFGEGGEDRQLVTLEELPENLVDAVVGLEDKRFYDHPGIDAIRWPKVLIGNFLAGRVTAGASTLTQQLAKDLYVTGIVGDTTRPRTYSQKWEEGWLALKIERHYSKKEILEIYLNQVYLGDRYQNVLGVAAAAQYYFGKPVSQLTLKECALIAGILQRPNVWSPFRNLNQATRRTNIALRAMLNEGYITEEEFHRAVEEPFLFRDRSTRRKPFVNKYPYFNAYVRRNFQWGNIPGPDGQPIVIAGTGVDVETTLDPDLQDIAVAALQSGIRAHEERRRKLHGSRWGEPTKSAPNADAPDKILPGYTYDAYIAAPCQPDATQVFVTFPRIQGGEQSRAAIFNATENWLDDFGLLKPDMCIRVSVGSSPSGLIYEVTRESYVQGALIAIQPSSGKILALVGGYDFYDTKNSGQFIFATQARRQPGSAFKPLLYACAVSRGYHPASLIEDREQIFQFGGKTWIPENFEGQYLDTVTLHEALAESLNAGSVWLLQHLSRSQSAGILSLHKFCRRTFDLRLRKTDLTLALGSEELTPLQLAKAYSVFASDGLLVEPYAVSAVREQIRSAGQEPRVLYEHRWEGRRTMDPAHARLVTSLLEGVASYGTARRIAADCKVPLVGKTGTTDNCTNAWFVGYGRDLVCVVFVGFESNRSLGDHMTGSKVALPVWIEFMNQAAEVRPDLFGEFNLPEGIVEKKICLDSGAVANPECPRSRKMLFLEKDAPILNCLLHGHRSPFPLNYDDHRTGTIPQPAPTKQVIPFEELPWSPITDYNLTPSAATQPYVRKPFPPTTTTPPEPTPTPKKRRPWWRF